MSVYVVPNEATHDRKPTGAVAQVRPLWPVCARCGQRHDTQLCAAEVRS